MLLQLKTDTYAAALAALRDNERVCESIGISPARFRAARIDLQNSMRDEITRELASDAPPALLRPQI